MRRGRGVSLLALVYVGVGVAIAANHNYFDNVHGWRGVLSAIFAMVIWFGPETRGRSMSEDGG